MINAQTFTDDYESYTAPNKFTIDELFTTLYNEDNEWALSPVEDKESFWHLSKPGYPGYDVTDADDNFSVTDSFCGYTKNEGTLDDFIAFIRRCQWLLDNFLEEGLNASVNLNSANIRLNENNVICQDDLAKELVRLAGERMMRDPSNCPIGAWNLISLGRPTLVDRNKVIVKRKPGESTEERDKRRQQKFEDLGSDTEEDTVAVITFKEKKTGTWITKSDLQVVVEDEVPGSSEERLQQGAITKVTGVKRHLILAWTPNHDPERNSGIGITDVGEAGNAKDKIFTQTYDVIDTGKGVQTDYAKCINWITLQMVNTLLEVFAHPPKRLIPLIKDNKLYTKSESAATATDPDDIHQAITKYPKTTAFRAVKEGLISGIELAKAHKEWAVEMFNKGLLEPEGLIQLFKNDTKILEKIVKAGKLPAEKIVALAKDPNFAKKLEKMGLYVPLTGNENKDINILLQEVQQGNITPAKAWELNRKTLFPMVEAGLLSPKDAYHLEPNSLTELMRQGYIGKEEGKRLSPQIKRRFNDEEWNNLKASIRRLRRGRHLNACTAHNFNACVQNCDDPVTIAALKRAGEFEHNEFDPRNATRWFASLDEEAKTIVFCLVMNWITGTY